MDADQLEGLLRDIGLGNRMRVIRGSSDTNFMFCCPWHQEQNPSAGISAEKEYGSCFGCKQGFTILSLVAYMKDVSFRKAKDFLEEKYNVEKRNTKTGRKILRYDADQVEEGGEATTDILPNFKLAPYKSGKVCHDYLLQRGFTKETCRLFKLGWDEARCRITIPIFNRENGLLGFIVRAVLDEKDPDYKSIYGGTDKYLVDNFKRSHTLFPVHLFPKECDTAVLVEGSLDAMWAKQLGFNNFLAILTSTISKEQILLLHRLRIKKIILFLDNDSAGQAGNAHAYKLLRNDFIMYKVEYPEGAKDPQDLTRQQIQAMLDEKTFYSTLSLKKLE